MRIFLTLASLSLLFTSCLKGPNEKTNEKLEGEWGATSIVIDGEEKFGDLYVKATTKFENTTEVKGKYTITRTTTFGSTSTDEGNYQIYDEGETITFTDSDNKDNSATISFDGDNYTMEYTNKQGQSEVEKAKKK